MSQAEANGRVAVRVDEVADRLGLGKTLVRALIRDGSIRSFRVGRCVLVPVDELTKFVAERMGDAPAVSGDG